MRNADLTSLLVAFGKRSFRNASLVNLTVRFPNADFTCLTWFRRDAGLNLASYLYWADSCSSL